MTITTSFPLFLNLEISSARVLSHDTRNSPSSWFTIKDEPIFITIRFDSFIMPVILLFFTTR